METKQIQEEFERVFGNTPDFVVQAPGRVNLIGEHIDYNGGPVLPIAIEKYFLIAVKRRSDKTLRLCSMQEEIAFEGTLPVFEKEQPDWVNYPLGVIHEFQKLDYVIPGFDAMINSTIPVASGLSSSAAFEVATAQALLTLLDTSMSPLELAQLCQRAENQFVGVNCGLMDQAASACSKKNHALLLDCAIPKFQWKPMPDAAVVVAHCGVQRGLSASAYNERRSQCEESLEIINQHFGTNYPYLCSVPVDVVDNLPDILDETHTKRSRHVITEVERVKNAIEFFAQGENIKAGEMLNQSHFSLQDDYEVSCTELNELTLIARTFPGVYGSRLTGAGFGGCTVTLVDPNRAGSLVKHLKTNYYNHKGIQPIVFITNAAEGASVIE